MAFMLGPVFFMLLKTSVLKGVRAALVFDLGVILCDISFMLLAYYGSRPLLEGLQHDPRLIFVGGILILIYGLYSFFDPNNKKELNEEEIRISRSKKYYKMFLSGFFINFLNVGVLATWLGIMIVVGPALNMNPNSIFWFFTKIIIGYLVTDLVKIFLAKQFQEKMTPLIVYKMKKGMGVLLILFGILILLKPLLIDLWESYI